MTDDHRDPPPGGVKESPAGAAPPAPVLLEDLEREAAHWESLLARASLARRDALAARLAGIDRRIAEGEVRRIGEVAVLLRRAWARFAVQAADPLGWKLLRAASAALERFADASDHGLLAVWQGLLVHEAAEWPDETGDCGGWRAASDLHAELARDIAACPVAGAAGMLVKLMLLRRATVLGETGFESLAADTLVDAVLRLPLVAADHFPPMRER